VVSRLVKDCPGRGRRSQRGAVAIEFALVLPLMITLLLGATTVGTTYSDHLAISNAVREGARLGAAIEYEGGGWADSVRERVQDVYFNGTSELSTDEICVQLVDSGGGEITSAMGSECAAAAPDNPEEVAAGSCLVKVWVRKPARILLGMAPDIRFTLSANSVSYYGRTVGSCTA
jgi:hypothetical protein